MHWYYDEAATALPATLVEHRLAPTPTSCTRSTRSTAGARGLRSASAARAYVLSIHGIAQPRVPRPPPAAASRCCAPRSRADGRGHRAFGGRRASAAPLRDRRSGRRARRRRAADYAAPVEPPADADPALPGLARRSAQARRRCCARPSSLFRAARPDARLGLAGGRDPGGLAGRRASSATRGAGEARAARAGRLPPRASATVLPADDEAFGLVLVESLAAGTPVVAARSGACPEIVDDPRVGRLFEPGDAEDLEQLMGEAALPERRAAHFKTAGAAGERDVLDARRRVRRGTREAPARRPCARGAAPPAAPSSRSPARFTRRSACAPSNVKTATSISTITVRSSAPASSAPSR